MSAMGELEFTTPRAAWGGEATDFTPLLATGGRLEYLGQACGLGELSLLDTEHATAGNRSLDILAELPDGRLVAIENQYGTADHDHLTRGLAYAVATEAAVLVVVAEDHRDEFVAVANYLNRIAGTDPDGIRVWLVQVRAVRRVGDSVWSPEFVIMAEPNEWEAAHRRSSPSLASLDDFYTKATEEAGSDYADAAKRVVEHWTSHPVGSEGHDSSRTVALYVPSTTGAGRTCALQLQLDGSLTVSRGYLRDGVPLFGDDAGTELLDERIRQHFPEAVWAGKRYHLRIPRFETEAVCRFATWILDKTGELIGTD